MRKRCIRKVWQKLNPIELAIQGAAITSETELDKLRRVELSAIAAFAGGKATISDWHDLCAVLNVAEQMAKAGIGPEVLEACETAQAHLIDAKDRFERTGRMGTTGLGLQSFRELYEYHDLQRQSISRSEYEKHMRKTIAIVKNKGPGVVEL